jgi:hypothetical protein
MFYIVCTETGKEKAHLNYAIASRARVYVGGLTHCMEHFAAGQTLGAFQA